MNIITIIQAALTGLNNTAELFMLEKARAENEELENTTDTVIVYPDWRETNQFNQALELQKTRVYNIDFKTPDEWDNSDNNIPTAYDSKTSADRIEDMAILADSVFSYISAHNNLFPEITQKLKWTSPRPILRAGNGTMSGVTVQLTVVFSGERICDYITTPVPVIPFPNPDDLNTWHKTITGNTLNESIAALPAKILPRVAEFNGVDDYIDYPSISGVESFHLVFYLPSQILPSDPIEALFNIDVSSNPFWLVAGAELAQLVLSDGNISTNLTSLSPGWHTATVVINSASSLTYVDGVDVTDSITTALTSYNFGAFQLGRRGNATFYFNGLISTLLLYDKHFTVQEILDFHSSKIMDNVGLILATYPAGQGDYDYDVSGNNIIGTWAGTGTRFTYDLNGSLYPNTNGYSLWKHATLDPIQVPFDINGNPLSLTPGVNIPVGYTWKRDLLPGVSNHNIYDSLIDFDPDGLGSVEVAIFDRSNVTRQTAASRASIYYDSNFPYRYHISEISDPRIYDAFFNPLFQNIIFGRIVLDSEGNTDIIRYDEELNYKTQREGDTLSENIIYCRFITNIYP